MSSLVGEVPSRGQASVRRGLTVKRSSSLVPLSEYASGTEAVQKATGAAPWVGGRMRPDNLPESGRRLDIAQFRVLRDPSKRGQGSR